MIWAIPIAIISARIYYVLFEWDYYAQHPGEIIQIWHGGIAIHGALNWIQCYYLFFCEKEGISFWKIADIAAPSIILGQAIGRWGNFMNQEAHGGEVTRAFLENLHLPDFIINQMYINGAYYHPTFLYESVWDFVGFIPAHLVTQSKSRTWGNIFILFNLVFDRSLFCRRDED